MRKTTQNSRTAKKYKNNADFVHKTKAKPIENKTMQQKSTRSNESQQRQCAVVGYSSVSGSITICGTTDCNYTFRLSLSLPASSCLTDQKVTIQRREHVRAATYSHQLRFILSSLLCIVVGVLSLLVLLFWIACFILDAAVVVVVVSRTSAEADYQVKSGLTLRSLCHISYICVPLTGSWFLLTDL